MGSAKTSFSFSSESMITAKVDGLIVPVFKSDKGLKLAQEPLKSLDQALQKQIQPVAEEEKFEGARSKTLAFRKGAGDKIQARRVILLGLGDADKLTPGGLESAVQKAVSSMLSLKGLQSIAILLPEPSKQCSREEALYGLVDAVHQATYRSAEAKEKSPDLKKILIIGNSDAKLKAVLAQAEVMAQARSFVKDLVNKPSNTKRTDTMVDAAKQIAKSGVVTVKVQSDPKWIEKNMPCFFTVARGSLASDPPKFITLSYQPKGGKAKKQIALIGKSVIFDTGGYQVKTGNFMNTMKGDMTGGAVALGTMLAISELQPKNIGITTYLAATPNKIDSDAMLPDSIVDTTCGKKVEIRHTDAEGRLTLIDAVTQATRATPKPDELLTVATLTGSASQAVGPYIALMGSDEALRDRIARVGRLVGEPIQTLDVTEDDYDAIKSKLDGADIINTTHKKYRGAQSAGAFVMSGAPEDLPKAHMDIAGADMTPDEKATGVALKTVLAYLLSEDGSLFPDGTARQPVPSAKNTKSPTAGRSVPGKAAARKTARQK